MQVKEELINMGDPERIGELVSILGITNDDFKDPVRHKRIQEVLDFLKQYPDPKYFIYKGVGSKQIDRVDFMHEYINLHKERSEYEQKLAKLDEQIKVYEK